MLKRIFALLLALADLAERAAGRSHPIRWLVLWPLCYADAVAREFVAGSAWAPARWPPALATIRYGTEPADAMQLGQSLRALACMVRTMADNIGRLSYLQFGQASGATIEDGPTLGLAAFIQRLGNAAFSPVERRDTS